MKTADELFKELGYEKKEFIYDEKHRYSNGIQYIKEDAKSEMERVGFITKQVIEIYYYHKEILKYHTQTFKDGRISRWDLAIFKLEELKAINQFCKEKGWLDEK